MPLYMQVTPKLVKKASYPEAFKFMHNILKATEYEEACSSWPDLSLDTPTVQFDGYWSNGTITVIVEYSHWLEDDKLLFKLYQLERQLVLAQGLLGLSKSDLNWFNKKGGAPKGAVGVALASESFMKQTEIQQQQMIAKIFHSHKALNASFLKVTWDNCYFVWTSNVKLLYEPSMQR